MMLNKFHPICLCLFILVAEASADFKLRPKAYRMDQLAQAQTEAEAKGQAIAIIWTYKNMSCPLSVDAGENMAQALTRRTIMIYADCATEKDKLPPSALKALNSPEAGRYLPKTVILDHTLQNVLAIIPYATRSELPKLLREAVKKLPPVSTRAASSRTATLQTGASGFSIEASDDRELRSWSIPGGIVRAKLISESAGRVTLRREDGVELEILTGSLGKEDQAYLLKMRRK